jgi:hypothetical protein
LISGCYFDEINQPDNAQQNENIQIELNIIDPFVPEPNPHKGVICVLVPTDWEFISGNYSFGENAGSMAFSEEWADSAENCYPAQLIHDDMHWISMISDTGYAYDDPIEITINIEFRVGLLTGCFPIGYIATKATPNLICSGVQSWAPISYPHPIQIETTDDCNPIAAVAEEDWSELFHRYEGWTGADGIYSIPFNGNEQSSDLNKTLFVFSDTFIGSVDSTTGERLPPTYLINNTYAVMDGNTPINENIDFYYHHDTDGNPTTLFIPNTENSQEGDWYWLMDGISINDRFYLFALRMDHGDDGQQAFAIAGVSLISFDLTENYEIFNLEEADTPLFYEDPEGWSVVYGQAILSKLAESGNPDPDGYIYFYGVKDGNGSKEMTVSRVPEEYIDNYLFWEYWDGNAWSPDISDSYSITQNISQEFSVSQISQDLYIAVFQLNGVGEEVAYRLGSSVIGPFGFFNIVWSTPESDLDPDYFTYNAKAHPHLSNEEALLISYNVNSYEFSDHFSDAGLYRPRFVSIPISAFDTSFLEVRQEFRLPSKISISRTYPNPFNPRINLELDIVDRGVLDISIYDVNGRFISKVHKGLINPGYHHFYWDGENAITRNASSGIYFIKASINHSTTSKKILYLK